MISRRVFIIGGLLTVISACNGKGTSPEASATVNTLEQAKPSRIRIYSASNKGYIMSDKVIKSDAEWRKQLTAEQYHVTREKGTERSFSGTLLNNHEQGVYQCVCCGSDLYSSEHKFESGTGWPSFWQPIAPENVTARADNSFFMKRTEVVCSRCEAHLGHVFEDGPKQTGLRHCINSVAMTFVK